MLLAATLLLLIGAAPALAVTGATTIDMTVDGHDPATTTGTWDTIGGRWSLTKSRAGVPTFAGGGTAITHPSYGAGDLCGYQATATGDVNGDGRDDAVLGCYGDDIGATNDAGSAIVATRNAANTGFDAPVVLSQPAAGASDQCGSSVAVGDVNGDGRGDVVVGCGLDDVGANNDAGSAVVFLRNVANDGFDTGVVLTAATPVAGDTCGTYQAVTVGDFNADGRGDVAVGCRGGDVGAISDAGTVLVFLRAAANTGFDPSITLSHPSAVAADRCGSGVVAGDVNADGRSDLIMGCPFDDIGAVNDAGSVVVLTRNAGNTGFDPGVVLASPTIAANDGCGFNDALGDVNGDGRADVVMACETDSVVAPSAGSAVVFVRNGSNTGFLAGVELRHPAPADSDVCGDSVAVSDVDGDGHDDVVAGCTLRDNAGSASGSTIVWARNAANTGFIPATERQAPTAATDDYCGTAVSGGDMNGDGLGDVLLDCGLDDIGASGNAGSGWVFLSTTTPVWTGVESIGSGQVYRHASPAAGDRCGVAMELGDVNYDGHADLVTGCENDDDAAGVDEGSVLVALRNASNDGFDPPTRFGSPSPSANAACGHAIAVGDFNGDSKRDLLSGCNGDDTNGTDSGSFVVMRRNEANDGFVQARWTHPAPAAGDQCGVGVAVGDVNADGHDDMIVGCAYDDSGATPDTGSVLVFTRNATNNGFDPPVTLTHPTMAANDWCGMTVASMDVNGDGRMDVVTGCPKDDVGVSDQGSAVVFTRNAANTGFDPGVVLEHPAPSTGDNCGYELASADVDGDGRSDLLLGCEGDDVGGVSDAGSAVLFLRRSDNTGYLTGTVYAPPTASAGDGCGDSIALGDVTGDGRADIVLGCRNIDDAAADGGGAVLLPRNASNTGFSAAQRITSPASGATAGCGVHVALGDVNGDARPELALGCFTADGAATDAGEVVLREAKRALVQTLTVAATARPITAATFTAPLVANGGALPALEASSDGGTTWDTVSSGVAHTFASPGTTLLARARIADTPSAGYATSPWVSGNIAVSYTYHEPRVTSTSPATLPQGRRAVVVTVNGSEFDPGATVAISGPGITITGTTWVSTSRIDVTLDIAGAATASARDVTVTNPDTGTNTRTAALTVTVPSLTVALSVLGYASAVRDASAPYALDMGMLLPGGVQQVGPTGSGQATPGSAVDVTVTSDTTWMLQAQGTDFSSGGNTMSIGQFAWKHFGVAEAWTPFAVTAQSIESAQPPTAGTTRSYDARLSLPLTQAAGTYSSTITYTVIAQP